jgi:hypothetical protein
MAESLFLNEARAKYDYACSNCGVRIRRGDRHFRHDPHPYARIFRNQRTSHWCAACIDPIPVHVDPITRRRRIRRISDGLLRLVEPVRVELVQVGPVITEWLARDPQAIYRITPEQFEEFVCDRLAAMGLEAARVGSINRKDGGLDVMFWPRRGAAFPFLGAAQVKHHKNPAFSEGPRSVRELAGTIANHPINAALLVTNTSFTPDAQWFARERAKLIRLRGFQDMKRWIAGEFEDSNEWREIPSSLELCPGVTFPIATSGR